jgi:hypothetical protein
MHNEQGVDEFFKTGHPVSDAKNPVVTVAFVRPQPATTPGQPEKHSKSVELLGLNAFGVVAKSTNESGAVAMFYPWPSIDHIQ